MLVRQAPDQKSLHLKEREGPKLHKSGNQGAILAQKGGEARSNDDPCDLFDC